MMVATMSKLGAVRAVLAREPDYNAKQLVRELRRAGVKLDGKLAHNYLSTVRREMREAKQLPPYPSRLLNEVPPDEPQQVFTATLDFLTRAKALISEAGGLDRFNTIVEAAFGR